MYHYIANYVMEEKVFPHVEHYYATIYLLLHVKGRCFSCNNLRHDKLLYIIQKH